MRHCSIAVITRRCAVEMTAPTSARKAVTVAAEDLRYRERGAWEEHGVPVMIGGSVDGLPAQPARSTTSTSSAHNSRMSAREMLAGRRTFPDAARPLHHEEASSLPIVAIPDLPIRLARGFPAPVRPTVGTNHTRRVHCFLTLLVRNLASTHVMLTGSPPNGWLSALSRVFHGSSSRGSPRHIPMVEHDGCPVRGREADDGEDQPVVLHVDTTTDLLDAVVGLPGAGVHRSSPSTAWLHPRLCRSSWWPLPRRRRATPHDNPAVTEGVTEAARLLYQDYKRQFRKWERDNAAPTGQRSPHPLMIAVVNNRRNAQKLHESLGGAARDADGDAGTRTRPAERRSRWGRDFVCAPVRHVRSWTGCAIWRTWFLSLWGVAALLLAAFLATGLVWGLHRGVFGAAVLIFALFAVSGRLQLEAGLVAGLLRPYSAILVASVLPEIVSVCCLIALAGSGVEFAPATVVAAHYCGALAGLAAARGVLALHGPVASVPTHLAPSDPVPPRGPVCVDRRIARRARRSCSSAARRYWLSLPPMRWLSAPRLWSMPG